MDVLLPTPRQTGTRPADHKQPFMSVVPSLPHTEEAGPPGPPPEPPPGVSTAPPRRMTSSGSTSSCPSCSSVFSSVHNMKAHGRRTNPGTPIVAEGLTRGFCDSSTVFPTSASRAGHYRKCQAYQRAKNGQRTSASSNESRSPSATPLLQPPPAAEPRQYTGGPAAHAVGMPRPRQLSIRLFGNTPSRTTATFKKEKPATSLRTARRPLNEQWQQSITKQIPPFSQHRKTMSPSQSQLPPMNSLRNTALSCNTSWYHPGPLSTHRCGWAPIHSSQ
ncbi:hypothetical protein Tc00.1047053504239.150 [Trypanosoma cruzi]|uniref:Uncharacterized protein n=1 Tax=Trypanosoma cruzi (strain CL Brener) TaxID=353153 RepID=Q4E069_TRYCC|nr:hypothetical protein Tc00.1047053504239.150 [Trypanosoma cruzi]EAN98161.1 hypothetical protein Tc00.1047053504239.150 [Trypanosoma cruzi]|eukprot:XP_820012.1 hypothetical protein [Trypanosoma cruzi strain CL Brener]